MAITHGLEHRMYFRILAESLELGPKHVSATDNRKQWLNDNPHWPPSAYLISALAYAEPNLGPNWIPIHGGQHERELCVFVMARNALVHFSGNLDQLDRPQPLPNSGRIRPQSDPSGVRTYVSNFATDLANGAITENSGKAVPAYLSVDNNSTVLLEDTAFGRISGMMTWLFSQAGLIVST